MLSSPARDPKADTLLEEARAASVKRLQATWEDIFARYGAIAEEDDDVVDLRTETLVVDKGIVRNTPSRKFGTMLAEMLGPESPLLRLSAKKRRRQDNGDELEDMEDLSEDEEPLASPSAPKRQRPKMTKVRRTLDYGAEVEVKSGESWDPDAFDELIGSPRVKTESHVKSEPSSAGSGVSSSSGTSSASSRIKDDDQDLSSSGREASSSSASTSPASHQILAQPQSDSTRTSSSGSTSGSKPDSSPGGSNPSHASSSSSSGSPSSNSGSGSASSSSTPRVDRGSAPSSRRGSARVSMASFHEDDDGEEDPLVSVCSTPAKAELGSSGQSSALSSDSAASPASSPVSRDASSPSRSSSHQSGPQSDSVSSDRSGSGNAAAGIGSDASEASRNDEHPDMGAPNDSAEAEDHEEDSALDSTIVGAKRIEEREPATPAAPRTISALGEASAPVASPAKVMVFRADGWKKVV